MVIVNDLGPEDLIPVHVPRRGRADEALAKAGDIAGLGAIHQVKVGLSPAQLVTLFSNPVTIVPAPGPGRCVFVLACAYFLKFASVAYALGDGDATVGLFYAGVGQSADSSRGQG